SCGGRCCWPRSPCWSSKPPSPPAALDRTLLGGPRGESAIQAPAVSSADLPRPNAILDAVESCRAVRELIARPPAPGARVTVASVCGSAATAIVAALHRRTGRVLVAVAPD